MTEFALLLPLLLVLLLGIVSVGIAYNHQIALTHAAREAGRYAATLPVANFATAANPLQAWLDEVASRVTDAGSGSLESTVPGRFVCVAYVHPNGTTAIDSTTSRVESGTDPVTYPSDDCFTDGRPNTERRVQILVRRDTDFNLFAFTKTVTLDADAVSRFEAALGA